MKRWITLLRGGRILVPPPATQCSFIHWVAFPIVSIVASSKDDENKSISPLKAIILNESDEVRLERHAASAVFTFSSGLPCMLPLISTRKTTSLLKTYWNYQNMNTIPSNNRPTAEQYNSRALHNPLKEKSSFNSAISYNINLDSMLRNFKENK